MSIGVCVHRIMRDPLLTGLPDHGRASGLVGKGTESSESLISATVAEMSTLNDPIICQPAAQHTIDTSSSTTSESHACTLPEILNSPGSPDTQFLLQMKKVTQKCMEKSITKNTDGNIERNSMFPNFRALQRLALSATTRISHVNQITRRSSSDYPESHLGDVNHSTTSDFSWKTVLQDAKDQVRSFQDTTSSASDAEISAGFSLLRGLPGNGLGDADKREAILHREPVNLYHEDHSVSSKTPKKKSAKKRKKKTRAMSRGQHLKTSLQDSKQRKPNLPDSKIRLQDTSLGSLLRALPVVVEPKKIEIYSSRYGKCASETINAGLMEVNVNGNKDPRLKLARRDLSQGNLASNSKTTNCDTNMAVTKMSPTVLGAVVPAGHQRQGRNDMARTTRVFLSEKQSGTMKECGFIFPCAPPGTPTPQMLLKYQYVPSMMDLRSQRTVRDRLVELEKKAKKRQQQLKEEAKKTEQQLQRDQLVAWKQRQRLEIYALNKLMTEFEERNFWESIKMMRGKTP